MDSNKFSVRLVYEAFVGYFHVYLNFSINTVIEASIVELAPLETKITLQLLLFLQTEIICLTAPTVQQCLKLFACYLDGVVFVAVQGKTYVSHLLMLWLLCTRTEKFKHKKQLPV